MLSIFNRIFQYRQSEQRTPREDYFTETFVAVIERHDELRRALAGWLAGLEVEKIQSVRIETQRSFSVADSGTPRRPDVWMEVKDVDDACHWIIVENKIDSGEGENQLSDYAKILEACSGVEEKTLVYITKFSSSTDPPSGKGVKFKHLRWPRVYDFLRKKLRDANESWELVNELLKLMEDWNMNGTLSATQLRAARVCVDSSVFKTLRMLQSDIITRSGLKEIVGKLGGRDLADQWTTEIPNYGLAFWIGFRSNRRDKGWDTEFLYPFVAVNPAGDNKEIGQSLSLPEHWAGAKGMNEDYKWVRQPLEGEMPRFGEPLFEFYKDFFQKACDELKRALEDLR